jgi:predicted CXXCH cytochrome family protein
MSKEFTPTLDYFPVSDKRSLSNPFKEEKMYRVAVLLILAVLMILPACAKRESEVSQRDMEQRPVAVTQEPGAERQAGVARQGGQTRESDEFMGQAPKVEDVPEPLVLEAKNGNVSFSHQKHAAIDCSTCHQGTPGKIPDFGKDKAHALCIGCHKERNAGPTKCGECHKKS